MKTFQVSLLLKSVDLLTLSPQKQSQYSPFHFHGYHTHKYNLLFFFTSLPKALHNMSSHDYFTQRPIVQWVNPQNDASVSQKEEMGFTGLSCGHSFFGNLSSHSPNSDCKQRKSHSSHQWLLSQPPQNSSHGIIAFALHFTLLWIHSNVDCYKVEVQP